MLCKPEQIAERKHYWGMGRALIIGCGEQLRLLFIMLPESDVFEEIMIHQEPSQNDALKKA